jgi:hypothetical protein
VPDSPFTDDARRRCRNRRSKWKPIPGYECPPIEPSEGGTHVRRAAAENRRYVYSTVECHVGPGASLSFAETKNASGPADGDDTRRCGRPIDSGLQIGTGHSNASTLLEPQLRSCDGDLERCDVGWISHQQVRDSMGEKIEGAAD